MATSAAVQEEAPATRFAKDQLKAIIERIERLEEEKKTISDDIRDVYAEGKGNGFDVKALRAIVRMRKQDPNERAEARDDSRDLHAGAGDAVRRASLLATVQRTRRDRVTQRMVRQAGRGAFTCFDDARIAVMGPRLRGTTADLRKRERAQRSDAVRITNDCVSSRAVAEPVKRSVTSPSVGSSEKLIATIACGLTK